MKGNVIRFAKSSGNYSRIYIKLYAKIMKEWEAFNFPRGLLDSQLNKWKVAASSLEFLNRQNPDDFIFVREWYRQWNAVDSVLHGCESSNFFGINFSRVACSSLWLTVKSDACCWDIKSGCIWPMRVGSIFSLYSKESVRQFSQLRVLGYESFDFN